MDSPKMTCPRWLCLGIAFTGLLCVPLGAQKAQEPITLEPPTGWELQVHSTGPKGEVLPPAPENFRRLGEAWVGQVADLHHLTLRFAEDVKIIGIQATQDFRVEQGSSCVAGNAYAAGTTCTLLVRFTPQGAGQRLGHVTISHSGSTTPYAFGLGGFGYGPVVSFTPAVISTVPGTYPANVGLLNGAHNLTVDSGDTLWIADTGNNAIRQMDSSGTFKTLASGYTGPLGIAVDTFGEAYFDLPASNAMYEIYDYGPVVQINGTGTGSCPASTPCTLSSHAVTNPGMLSIDPYNHLFFPEQTSGAAMSTVQPIPANLIFLYDPFPYQVSPSAAVAVDSGDNIYSLWATGGNCEIVQQSLYNAENSTVAFNKIAGGHTCGFSGDGGLAGNAEIGATIGQMVFDLAGNLYFSDTANQRVRRISYTTGVISTIAGNGTAGYTGDGGAATASTLSKPTGVGVDSQGQVYIISSTSATATAQVIRKVGPNGSASFGNQVINTSSPTKLVTVSNVGNAALTLTSAVIAGANATSFLIDTTSTNCMLASGTQLASGASCRIGISFKPTTAGAKSAVLELLDNTVNGADSINLSGAGILPSATFAITSPTSGQSFTSGTAVTFSVSVTSTSGPAPTGTVQFKVDGANYGSPVTISSGKASTTVTGLTTASHTLSATYSGDANYAPGGPISVSIGVTAVIVKPKVVIKPAAIGVATCGYKTFSVTVSGSSPVPTGKVQLMDGGKLLASGQLTSGATTLAAVLSVGSHLLSAHYDGDAHHLPADSATLNEMVLPGGVCGSPIIPMY